MNSFNVLNDNWIRAKYKDGRTEEIGIRQLFKDADKISDMLPPIFRNEEVSLFYPPLLWLLSTIVSAAYYKEETSFTAKKRNYIDKLREQDGLYTEEIKQYLDKFEDRFDVFSETHPFLQNIKLKPEFDSMKPDDFDYLTYNPLAPSNNNKIFGSNRKIHIEGETSVLKQYRMSVKEFVYNLILWATIGNWTSHNSSHEASLGRDAAIFPVIKGSTIKETILLNTLDLNKSSRPIEGDEKPDMPVWEMDDIHEMEEYSMEQLTNNALCKMFFPGISILGKGVDEKGFITGIVRVKLTNTEKGYGLPDEIATTISKNIPFPYGIFYQKENKDKKTIEMKAKQFSPETDTAYGLCISATQHTETWESCPIITSRPIPPGNKVFIYYREMDKMHTTLLSYGMLNGHNTPAWEKFKDENNHAQAELYQKNYGDIVKKLAAAIKSAITFNTTSKNKDNGNSMVNSAKRRLSNWMETDFFGIFAESLDGSEDSTAAMDATKRLGIATIEVYDEITRYFPGQNKVVLARDILNKAIYKITNPKERKVKKDDK